jgi:cytochrome c556
MQKREFVFLAGVIVVLCTGAVIAQSDPIATRKAMMKQNNDNAIAMVKMMRGLAPFDPARIDAAFAQWTDTAEKFPGLFPDNSKMGGKTRASSKVWLNKKDFDAKAAAFGKAVADNRDKAKTSANALRAAIPAIGEACDDCHKDYRVSQQ